MENRKYMVTMKDPMCFEAHPLNKEIYGTEELDTDFKEDIRDNGIREPIVVNREGLIISGHRRWRAAITIGLPEVPIRIEEFESPEKEEEALIAYNKQRVKNKAQIVREIERLNLIYETLGLSRRLSNLKQFEENDTEVALVQHREEDTKIPENIPNFENGLDYLNTLKKGAIPGKGRSNEQIAEQVGVSPRTVSSVKKVLKASNDEDPKISEPAKEIKKDMESGKIGFKTGAEKVNKLIKKSKGQRGRPKGSTSGPISATGVKTLVQSRLADFTAENMELKYLGNGLWNRPRRNPWKQRN